LICNSGNQYAATELTILLLLQRLPRWHCRLNKSLDLSEQKTFYAGPGLSGSNKRVACASGFLVGYVQYHSPVSALVAFFLLLFSLFW
jgi:hypothetical protein